MAGYTDDFMGWVEMHEHNWTDNPYPNRPPLADILRTPVVTFWKPHKEEKQGRYYVRCFADLRAVESHFVKLMMRSELEAPQDRLIRIYSNQKQVIIAGIKMDFQEVSAGQSPKPIQIESKPAPPVKPVKPTDNEAKTKKIDEPDRNNRLHRR